MYIRIWFVGCLVICCLFCLYVFTRNVYWNNIAVVLHFCLMEVIALFYAYNLQCEHMPFAAVLGVHNHLLFAKIWLPLVNAAAEGNLSTLSEHGVSASVINNAVRVKFACTSVTVRKCGPVRH